MNGISSDTRAHARMAENINVAGSFTITPPETFDFTKPQDWERWIKRFNRFRMVSGLRKTGDENRVNSLLYCMGEKADDVLEGLNVTDHNNYDDVVAAFQNFFIRKKNVIYERAIFNRRIQEKTNLFMTS